MSLVDKILSPNSNFLLFIAESINELVIRIKEEELEEVKEELYNLHLKLERGDISIEIFESKEKILLDQLEDLN